MRTWEGKMSNSIILDGVKYFRESFLGKLEDVFLDDFHIILHRKEVEIKGRKCFMCGEVFTQKNLTKHHAIPKKLKSIYNVHIPLCVKCHKKFNNFIDADTNTKAKLEGKDGI